MQSNRKDPMRQDNPDPRFAAVEARRRTGGFRASLAVLVMVLSSCAARPGPETLLPVANPNAGGTPITVLSMTNRAGTGTVPPVYGSGRGAPSFEEFTFLTRPPAAQADDRRTPEADPSKELVTVGRRLMSEAAFQDEVIRRTAPRDTPITVFVHGYNYSYQEAVFRVAQLSVETSESSVPILFSWPSDGRASGYLADRDGATYARDDLVRLLVALRQDAPGRNIGVIGHSMGAWLVMEALRQMRMQGQGDIVDQLQVVLAAPDIDIDVFRKQAGAVGSLPTPLTLLVSPDDRALAVSGGLAGRRARVGNAGLNDPELLAIAQQNGMRVFDISAVPATGGLNHDRYIAFAARYADMAGDGREGDRFRRAGIYLLDTTGRILSSPFDAASRALGGE